MTLSEAVAALEDFAAAAGLTSRIAGVEGALAAATRRDVDAYLKREKISQSLLEAAVMVKRAAAQVNVAVHAIGIVRALPYVLRPGERIESLSLGAGNTGRPFDLETNRQIAEFTFIGWRGGPESIRQNKLFIDFFNLASAATTKRRVLYVVGRTIPMKFFANRRAIRSVLSRNAAAARNFNTLYADRFLQVADYYSAVHDAVEIVDLAGVVPGLEAIVNSEVL